MTAEHKHALFWTNFPEGYEKSNLGFLNYGPLPIHLFDPVPSMIWTGNSRIIELEELTLSKSIVKSLNRTGLNIYLYEPACYRIEGNEHNKSFYSEFNNNISTELISCDELESINIFAIDNSLTNITVFAGDYNIQKLSKQYPNLILKCYDIFLRTLKFVPSNVIHQNWVYYGQKIKRFLFPKKLKKRFWSGNWRYTAHRHLVAAYLATLDGTYSWNFIGSAEYINQVFWFDNSKLTNDQLLRLQTGTVALDRSRFTIDKDITPTAIDNPNNVHIPNANVSDPSKNFLHSYYDCFCAVVTETRYAQPYSNISEKILMAVHARRPIILVAPPNSLEYFKTFGFKTFDRWWDESYDQETDHGARMVQIFNIIDSINNKSIDELQVIYDEMKDILDHNEKVLATIITNTTIL